MRNAEKLPARIQHSDGIAGLRLPAIRNVARKDPAVPAGGAIRTLSTDFYRDQLLHRLVAHGFQSPYAVFGRGMRGKQGR